MKNANPVDNLCDVSHIKLYDKLAIAAGLFPSISVISKFGANADVDIGTEDIWTHGGLFNYLTVPSILNVTSLSPLDTLLGVGMRTMVVEGLDENWDEVTETIEMNGTAIVLTATTYIRVNRMYCVESGTSDTNVGEVHIFAGTATAGLPDDELLVYNQISPLLGQTLTAAYAIPAGRSAYLMSGFATTDDVAKPITITMYNRVNADLETASWRVAINFKTTRVFEKEYDIPIKLPPKTDLRVQVAATANNTYVSAGFDLVLVDE